MGCRCGDIAVMTRDQERLIVAIKCVSDMADADSAINSSLKGIAEKIPDTLVIPDESFVLKMNALNDDSQCAISDIGVGLTKAFCTLNEEISNAKSEDFWFHLEHPFD